MEEFPTLGKARAFLSAERERERVGDPQESGEDVIAKSFLLITYSSIVSTLTN